MEKHPLHLKNPELQTSPEVERAVVRDERQTDKDIPNDPAERIDAYMNRLENIFLNPDGRVRERNLEMFRDQIYDQLIIKKENFPDSYFELQQRVAREQGHGDIQITPEIREQMINTAIEDQKHSLDAWMEYLTSDDAMYPAWFKYYAWNQITKLSQFDKERDEFKKRTKSTVAPYPDIYREPLAQIADLYKRVKGNNKDSEARKEFDKKFPALYAELIQKSLAAQIENKEEVKGTWIKYEQGKNGEAERLFQSLEGKGTGWCTAGRSTAETQIKSGDFYVYYTNDKNNNPTQPRLAIRMDGDKKIAEVRGVLPNQNVEPAMQEVLDEKLKDFGPEAEVYRKKSWDMKKLTEIENKTKEKQSLTRAELTFLYEVDEKIEGFGYQRDPRINELRQGRDPEEDILIIFDIARDEIAHNLDEVTGKTKVYIGSLGPDIFQKLPPGLEHMYTTFPEGNLKRYEVVTGDKTKEELKLLLKQANVIFSTEVENLIDDIINSKLLAENKIIDLIQLSTEDLKLENNATLEEIYKKAQELGLALCPVEVGPFLRLIYDARDWVSIGMQPVISNSSKLSCIFQLGHGVDGKWLRLAPGTGFRQAGASNNQFVFSLSKK